MITTLIASIALAQAAAPEPLHCAVMTKGYANLEGPSVVYAGAVFHFCCPGCDANFAKTPAKFVASAAKGTTPIGKFLFDPTTGKKVDTGSGFTTDHKGIRYFFETKANLETFKAKPEKFASMPTKEVLTCPVAGDKMASPKDAFAYVDVKGVRYYICCAGCMPKMEKESAKYIAKMKPTTAVGHKG